MVFVAEIFHREQNQECRKILDMSSKRKSQPSRIRDQHQDIEQEEPCFPLIEVSKEKG